MSGRPLRGSGTAGVLRLAVFFLVFGAVAWTANTLITRGLRSIRTSDFGATNRMLSGAVNADIVITGSSRAYDHYDPRVIRKITGRSAFNLGRNGSQTDMQVAVLRAYLAHNRAPRLVIHNLDLFSFVTSHEIYDPGQYLPYLGEPSLYAGVRRVYPDAWKWRYIPLYGYAVEDMRFDWMQGVAALFGHQPAENLYDGFDPRHTAWTGDFDKYAAQHPTGVATPVEGAGVRDVEDLAQLCRSHGIRLLFVYSPEFQPMQKLESNRQSIFARFRNIASNYGVTLWDYSDSPLCSQRRYFYNSQHLNADGAELFSIDLAKRLEYSELLK